MINWEGGNMLVVSVDLISARTGEKKNLGKVIIANDGTGTDARGNYFIRALRAGTSLVGWHNKKPTRVGSVVNYPRNKESVWTLVTRALVSLGYEPDDASGPCSTPCDQQDERQAS